ncbi:MAG: hypothetical protein OHK0021_10690 [Bryobacter sp.]
MKFTRRTFALASFAHVLLRAEEVPSVPWKTLRMLDLASGQAAPSLKKLDGTRVRVAGYMVPLEDDEQEEAFEYLIVPIAGGCIHTPPPPPNQIVHCLMNGKKKTRVRMFDPQWFEGKLTIQRTESPYGPVSYKLAVEAAYPYQAK